MQAGLHWCRWIGKHLQKAERRCRLLQGAGGLAEAFIFPKFANYKAKVVRVRDKTSPFAMFHSKNFQ